MARTSGDLREAERLQRSAHRCLAEGDAELIPNPCRKVDQTPSHNAVHRRDRSVLHDLGEGRPLFVVQLRRIAGRLAVDQTVRPFSVKAFDSVADDLTPDAADPRCLRPTTAIVNHRQCQKPARLIGVSACSSQALQIIRRA